MTRINNYVDIVLGLQYGDEGKGKITAGISEQKDYQLTARYNGGSNAGHTIHIDGKQLKLHQLPSSIAYKKEGYIGPGTCVNFTKLEKEAETFREIMGFDPFQYLYISPQAIVISDAHIKTDKAFHATNQGSTSSGIAPAYASFYNRTASLAGSYTFPSFNGEETIEEPFEADNMLLEGAQGYYLNPYQGSYPYTTSSSCHPGAAAATFGFSTNKIRNIIGVAKCYETRSGIDPDFYLAMTENGFFKLPEKTSDTTYWIRDTYDKLQSFGKEIGVTTGRRRKIKFLDLTALINAVNNTGTNILVINKWDILESLPRNKAFPFDCAYSYYLDGTLVEGDINMRVNITKILYKSCPNLKNIIHSASPHNDIDWSLYLD